MINIAIKELKDLLYSPKFLIISTTAFILILISLVNGYAHYDLEKNIAAEEQQIIDNDMRSKESYRSLSSTTVLRFPEKLSIFDIGVSGVVGRKSYVGSFSGPRSRESRYGLNPILAVFGELDLNFIVAIILSLFALLFSYNSINGEREKGTLQLTMSNSIRRTSIITGKLIGGYTTLLLIFIVPFLLGLSSLLILTDLNFSGDEWLRLFLMALVFSLYLLVFYCVGLAMSALTRQSFVSFILCLLIWVAAVGIIPRIAVHSASFINPSMSTDELQKKLRRIWRTEGRSLRIRVEQKYFDENPTTEEEYKKNRQDIFDLIWEDYAKEQNKYMDKIYSEYDRRRRAMVETATLISRISPTSCSSLAVHAIANTGPLMLENFEDNLTQYQDEFVAWTKYKWQKHKDEDRNRQQPVEINKGDDGFMKASINEDYKPPELDLSGLPRFQNSFPAIAETTGEVLPYFVFLFSYAIIFFVIAYVAFLRYDVR